MPRNTKIIETSGGKWFFIGAGEKVGQRKNVSENCEMVKKWAFAIAGSCFSPRDGYYGYG